VPIDQTYSTLGFPWLILVPLICFSVKEYLAYPCLLDLMAFAILKMSRTLDVTAGGAVLSMNSTWSLPVYPLICAGSEEILSRFWACH
jgi:hypothetical protein